MLTRTEAVEIDRQGKRVRVRNLDSGKDENIPYDKLVLATGGRPYQPPFPGLELENVWYMRHLDDARSMAERIGTEGLKKAVVVGAGYIGVEMAEALRMRGLDVIMVELFDQIMPQFLDPEMALLAAKHIRQKGVELALGEKVIALEGDGKVASVRTDKRTLPADLVVIGVGVSPTMSWPEEAVLPALPKEAFSSTATAGQAIPIYTQVEIVWSTTTLTPLPGRHFSCRSAPLPISTEERSRTTLRAVRRNLPELRPPACAGRLILPWAVPG